MFRIAVAAIGCLFLLLCISCDVPNTRPAGGSVVVDGKPVENGTVTFYPTAGGRSASGRIKGDGTFVLSYKKVGDGVPPGTYKVVIVGDKWIPMSPNQKTPDALSEEDEVAFDDMRGKLEHVVPVIYNSIDTTPLERVVESADDVQDFKIEISTKNQ